MKGYILLVGAILFEVVATSSLKATDGFTRIYPSLVVLVGYILSFVLLSHVVKYVPLGIAYAIWSGLGIIATAAVGFYAYGQKLDVPALAGMGLIVAGVLVINLFSKVSGH